MIKPKIVKTRKFVSENRTLLAFAAGSIFTSAFTYAALGGSTTDLLKVTKEQAEMLKEGKLVLEYALKDQTLTLVNIPACEAAQALL